MTNTGVDTQDLYVLNATATSYAYDGVLYPFQLRQETIRVKGDADVPLTVRSTLHHGAVVSDCSELVGERIARSGVALALRWVSTDPTIKDTTFAAFYGLQRASDWKTFRAALAKWTAPSQNVVFAQAPGRRSDGSGGSSGDGGAIGYQMPGHVPLRDRSTPLTLNNTGAWPVPGDSSAFAWQAQPWDFNALPRALNPRKEYIVTANNPPMPQDWPHFLSADWDCGGEGYRAARITELVQRDAGAGGAGKAAGQEGGGHTPDSISRVQTDYRSLFAEALCSALVDCLRTAAATPAGAALAARLDAWDKLMAVGSTEATLFADVWARLGVLGAGEGGGGGVWRDPQFRLAALRSDGAGGCSDPACAAAGHATCAAAAAAALDATAAAFGLAEGRKAVPRWGVDVHLARAEHEVLHGSALGCLADRQVGHGGDAYTVNVGGFDLEDAARVQSHGPSVRHVMVLGESEDASKWVQPMGQEGDLLSAQYDNLLERWAAGAYIPMAWDFVEKEALVLAP